MSRCHTKGAYVKLRHGECRAAAEATATPRNLTMRTNTPALRLLALALSLLALPARGQDLPELRFEAPPELQPVVETLARVDRQRLDEAVWVTGARRPQRSIRVVLADERSEQARNTPDWVAGYAYGALGLIVLFPARSPTYPDSTLEEVLLHEISHVLTDRAAGGRPVPRWFNEGLAMYVGRPWNLEDRSRVTWTLLVDDEPTLTDLDDAFGGGRTSAARAYAISGAFVRDLVRRHGKRFPAQLLREVSRGTAFEDAFFRASGEEVSRAEEMFWHRHGIWYRWVPVLTSSVTLWMAITLLALVAMRRRRLRDAALMRRWEEEEAEEARRRLLELAETEDVN